MKNIHVIPTPNSSRLVKQKYDTIDRLCLADMATKRAEYKRFNIYITSDELIKDGYYLDLTHNIIMKSIFYNSSDKNCKKIILTTDKSLDGVQAIDDEFLEWFVKNPSCEEVKTQLKLPWESSKDEYEIIIPKEEHEIYTQDDYFNDEFPKEKQSTKERILSETSDEVKQRVRDRANSLVNKEETLSEAAEKYVEINVAKNVAKLMYKEHFVEGAKWQQEKSYSEKEILNITQQLRIKLKSGILKWQDDFEFDLEEWFEQFKKK